ncbi:DEAD-domain-containing protein [Agrocybe pediades]|nr:DEAD-domain-containing protein [Agrocybe pediades]
MASKSLSLSSSMKTKMLLAGASASNGVAAANVGARRSFFVMAAVTRSSLPRKLCQSELLRPTLATLPTIRYASTATAPASSTEASLAEELDAVLEEDSAVGTADPSLAFSRLADSIHPATLKAITVHPFQHTHMSPVQAKILPMLPSLAMPRNHRHPEDNVPGLGSMDYMLDVDSNPKDLLVKAKTGTGKTMAFLVPAIEARLAQLSSHAAKIQAEANAASTPLSRGDIAAALNKYAQDNVGTLIISPTRELATQIAVEAQNLTTHQQGWQVQVLLGGESKGMQIGQWTGRGSYNDRRKSRDNTAGRKDIVVATPGRLLDLLNSEPGFKDAFAGCRMFILDEADTLLDMGFRDDIERIAAFLPPSSQRQTFLFSATVSRAIQSIAQSTLSKDHEFVNCVSEDDSPVHAHIPQFHTVVKSAEELSPHVLRLIALDQLEHAAGDGQFKKGNKSKVIIFLSTTNMVNVFANVIRKSLSVLPAGPGSSRAGGTQIFEMHAKLDMKQRMRVSAAFRGEKEDAMAHKKVPGRYQSRGSSPYSHAKEGPKILITSDVSARGVDYPGVTRVIQVGAPASEDIYVHRVGRTGRGSNKTGRGDLVLMPFEMGFVRRRLGKFGLGAVTVGDVEKELVDRVEGLASAASASSSSTSTPAYTKASVAEIPILAREVQHGMASQDPERVSGAYCSQLGFFIGKSREIGLEIREVVRGLKTMWMEMWGLVREPNMSRNLREMVDAAERGSGFVGGGSRDRRGGYGGGGGGRGGSYSSSSGSAYGNRGGSGSSSYGDRYGGSNANAGNSWSSDSSSSSSSYSRSNNNARAFTDSGYGYAKGTRAGFGHEKMFSRRKDAGWEDGGSSAWRGRDSSSERGSYDRGSGSGGSRSRESQPWQTRGKVRGRDEGRRRDWRSDID